MMSFEGDDRSRRNDDKRPGGANHNGQDDKLGIGICSVPVACSVERANR
jgi:hypothetical protein